MTNSYPLREYFKTRLMFKKLLLIIFIFLAFTSIIGAQNQLVDSTLAQANRLRDANRFEEAAAILGSFEKQYPGNIWVERLFAQTLFWMQDFDGAATIYERAIGYHPEDMAVKFEYALMLFDQNNFEKAKPLLLEYTQAPEYAGEAEALLAKINYYLGEYGDASSHLQKAIALNPNDQSVVKMHHEVQRIIRPNLGIGADYINDQQPMQTIGPSLQFNWYRSNMLDFSVSGNLLKYADIPNPNIISSLLFTNRFHINNSRLKIHVSAGGFYSDLGKEINWAGSIQLVKEFVSPLKIDLKVERSNYSYTISSVSSLLMVNQVALNISIGRQDDWNGLLGSQLISFPDDNYVNSYYAWVLSRPIKFSSFKLSLGYAFSYMNAKEDRFAPATTVEQIIEDETYDQKIEGRYDPYYTPINQINNSLLLNLSFQPSPSAIFNAHASVGLYSLIDGPYFFLDHDTENNLTIKKDFATQNYIPMDLGISFRKEISKKLELTTSYRYLSTYYFVSHNFNLGFKLYL